MCMGRAGACVWKVCGVVRSAGQEPGPDDSPAALEDGLTSLELSRLKRGRCANGPLWLLQLCHVCVCT